MTTTWTRLNAQLLRLNGEHLVKGHLGPRIALLCTCWLSS